jgi:hypothetical protein
MTSNFVSKSRMTVDKFTKSMQKCLSITVKR